MSAAQGLLQTSAALCSPYLPCYTKPAASLRDSMTSGRSGDMTTTQAGRRSGSSRALPGNSAAHQPSTCDPHCDHDVPAPMVPGSSKKRKALDEETIETSRHPLQITNHKLQPLQPLAAAVHSHSVPDTLPLHPDASATAQDCYTVTTPNKRQRLRHYSSFLGSSQLAAAGVTADCADGDRPSSWYPRLVGAPLGTHTSHTPSPSALHATPHNHDTPRAPGGGPDPAPPLHPAAAHQAAPEGPTELSEQEFLGGWLYQPCPLPQALQGEPQPTLEADPPPPTNSPPHT